MAEANANPEKRLFISLITRDIGLVDAVIDLTDNCVNAAMKPIRNPFSSAADFHRLFTRTDLEPQVTIRITFDEDHITVTDDASGIDFESARNETFRFGHSPQYHGSRDRLSVYGIGMKRALFKIGNDVSIISDHRSGGFSLKLPVQKWADDPRVPWVFPIHRRPPSATKTGTKIEIRQLHKEIRSRLGDGRFEDDLIEKLGKVYSYFVGRLVTIKVNNRHVASTEFEIGRNYSHDRFRADGVDCSITAGIAKAPGEKFIAENSGWFVFCNFRTVIYADKTLLTGWGASLPQFQPKHRPFLGLVSFTSADPELLPWTTTKGSINEDNSVWQDAKTRMVAVAKPIIRFLDTRYSDEGTEIQPSQLAQVSGAAANVFETTVSKERLFKALRRAATKDVKVQYFAKRTELERIRRHFSRSNMSASEIGRRTFEHFLRNEVGAE